MEPLHLQSQLERTPFHFMTTSLCYKLKPAFSFTSTRSANLRFFCNCSSAALDLTQNLNDFPVLVPKKSISRNKYSRSEVKLAEAQLKANWLASLSYPLLDKTLSLNAEADNVTLVDKTLSLNAEDDNSTQNNANSVWVIGVDPDVSGAVALLKSNELGCSAQVFDSPHLEVMVGKRKRKRLDAKSIVQLVQSFDAPIGTVAYIEQSIPYPKDGKQGWWSGGFGYGLWIGILVASGFSVSPVPSYTWKKEFDLVGSSSSKDDSRRVASTMFPSLSSDLRRKKDHGRAEALLIAAYGNGLKIPLDSSSSCISEDLEI